MSRTPVREALRQLHAAGLVELVPQRGALVRGPSARDVYEAYAVRAELEELAAQLAAQHVTDEELARLAEAQSLFQSAVAQHVAASSRAVQPSVEPAWHRANDLFHEAILVASGNRHLEETVEYLHQRFPRNLTWSALAGSTRELRENANEHARIRDRIERHDGPGALRVTRAHILRAGELVARRLE